MHCIYNIHVSATSNNRYDRYKDVHVNEFDQAKLNNVLRYLLFKVKIDGM
jgi:hypothetical protein